MGLILILKLFMLLVQRLDSDASERCNEFMSDFGFGVTQRSIIQLFSRCTGLAAWTMVALAHVATGMVTKARILSCLNSSPRNINTNLGRDSAARQGKRLEPRSRLRKAIRIERNCGQTRQRLTARFELFPRSSTRVNPHYTSASCHPISSSPSIYPVAADDDGTGIVCSEDLE